MFKILTDLIMHKQIQFEKGQISIFGRPSSLIPTDCFVKIQKELDELGKVNLIYFSGKESGKSWFEEMSKSYNLKGRDVIKWGSDIVTLAGWGEAIIKKREDSKKLIIFNLNDSATAKFYKKKTKYVVDHLFRGLLCGAMEAIFKEELGCVEVSCISKGDSFCEFIVKPIGDFDMSNPLTKEQLSPVK